MDVLEFSAEPRGLGREHVPHTTSAGVFALGAALFDVQVARPIYPLVENADIVVQPRLEKMQEENGNITET